MSFDSGRISLDQAACKLLRREPTLTRAQIAKRLDVAESTLRYQPRLRDKLKARAYAGEQSRAPDGVAKAAVRAAPAVPEPPSVGGGGRGAAVTIVGRRNLARARDPHERRGAGRDKDGRVLLQVFRLRRAEGTDAFLAWLRPIAATILKQLEDGIDSPDPRVAFGCAKATLELHHEALVAEARLSAAEAEALERYVATASQSSHSARRGASWRDGLTVRQERDARVAARSEAPGASTAAPAAPDTHDPRKGA